jgi:hypothetical protein
MSRAPRFYRRNSRAKGIIEDERRRDDRRVDEAGKDSFPASDPPPWTLGIEMRVPQPTGFLRRIADAVRSRYLGIRTLRVPEKRASYRSR